MPIKVKIRRHTLKRARMPGGDFGCSSAVSSAHQARFFKETIPIAFRT